MHKSKRRHSKALRYDCAIGFSLIELVIVLVIISALGAIAIPRMRKAGSRAEVAALTDNWRLLNQAAEHFAAEHDTTYPSTSQVVDQLTRYSDVTGQNFADAPDEGNGIIYGPYMLKIPPVSLGPHKGESGVGLTNDPGIGWFYYVSPSSGASWFFPNLLDESDNIPPEVEEQLGW